MIFLPDLVVAVLAFGFALMGVGAIAAPPLVTRQFGIPTLDADGRSEVRAVYGGFGLVIAAMLGLALAEPDLRAGVCLTVGVALGGMAGGRLVSWAIDRRIGKAPMSYLVIETMGASALLCAA